MGDVNVARTSDYAHVAYRPISLHATGYVAYCMGVKAALHSTKSCAITHRQSATASSC